MIYYVYDEQTKEFLYPVNVMEQPNNSTEIEPIDSEGQGLYEPIHWMGNRWVGLL